MPIRERIVANLRNVDEDLASRVAAGLGMTLPDKSEVAVPARTDLPASDALSILKKGPDSFAGRKLGLLVADGSDAGLVAEVSTAFADAGARVAVVAPTAGPCALSDGTEVAPDHALAAAPSVLFDAVAVVVSAEAAGELAQRASAKEWVTTAFAHKKFIGVTAGADALLTAAGVSPDQGVVTLTSGATQGFVDACATLRVWERNVKP